MVRTEETSANVDNWTVLMVRTGDREYVRTCGKQDSLNGEDRGQRRHPHLWTPGESHGEDWEQGRHPHIWTPGQSRW